MIKNPYRKHQIRRTVNGERALRARLSLRETQEEFAKRFLVSPITIHNWETGKTTHMQGMHKRILEVLVERLKAEGRYMPQEAYETILRTSQEQRNADTAVLV